MIDCAFREDTLPVDLVLDIMAVFSLGPCPCILCTVD